MQIGTHVITPSGHYGIIQGIDRDYYIVYVDYGRGSIHVEYYKEEDLRVSR